ncbi:unnamed protein product, partial [Meganyctiphanes norvegica]
FSVKQDFAMRLASHVWGFQTYRSLCQSGGRGACTCKIRIKNTIDLQNTLLQQSFKSSSNIVSEARLIHTTSLLQKNGQKRPKLKVFYVPNPFRWIYNTLELGKLRQEWDPNFDLDDFKYGATQINNTVITPDDVQVTQLNNVNLQTIVENRYCDIDIGVIAVRQPYNPEKHAIIMLEYHARFHRNYSEGQLPEWTVTRISLKRFQAIAK